MSLLSWIVLLGALAIVALGLRAIYWACHAGDDVPPTFWPSKRLEDQYVMPVTQVEKDAWAEIYADEAAERAERAACHAAGEEYQPLPPWVYRRPR